MNAPSLVLSRCAGCELLYLPTPGPCPRCASRRATPVEVPPTGIVLAATEVESPAEGWPSPHRLALVEVEDSVRLLAIIEGPWPAAGDAVGVRREGDAYRVQRPRPDPRRE